MRKLLHLLRDQRVEDTLTECICYLLDNTQDKGTSFVKEIFGYDTDQVYFESQLGIKINEQGQWIRPDIIFNIRLRDGTFKTIVVECKYGDALDKSKFDYFNYFLKFPNCELWLLCPDTEQSSQIERMKEYKLDFKITTFEKVVEAVKGIPPEDEVILQFIKEHTWTGYKIEKQLSIEALQSLKDQVMSLPIPNDFLSQFMILISERSKETRNRFFLKEHNEQDDLNPLEFEIEHPAKGILFFSIPFFLTHGTALTARNESSKPRSASLLAIRKKSVFHAADVDLPIEWMKRNLFELLYNLFLNVYNSKREMRISSYIGQDSHYPDKYIVMAIGTSQALEIAFKNEIELRIRFDDHSWLAENWDNWFVILEKFADISKYDGLKGHFSEKFADRAIKINSFRDVGNAYEVISEIISSGKKFEEEWRRTKERFGIK